MYILQALCALTIASLCTDVEAEWYIFANRYEYIWYTSSQATNKVLKFDDRLDNRKYTGTETLYFKVKCDSSPVTINQIKVDGFKGNLLLSAESAKSNICSGQTSECLSSKQIQEKEFFISVKPNPDFIGGQLTLKLKQAGKIYVINHEGARQYDKNNIRLYSGYHPVKFPEKLPQYKITCKGNCQIYKIYGQGHNFNIALARHPVKIGKDGCTDCSCTTKREGQKVFCKKDGGDSFDLTTSSFYITLDPRKERKVVTDAEVTINGANFESVTRAGYPTRICFGHGTSYKTRRGEICKCKFHYTGPFCEHCKIDRIWSNGHCCWERHEYKNNRCVFSPTFTLTTSRDWESFGSLGLGR